ncbi:MAG: ABC transporter permease subunit [SAR324 cluster bacterium]|nr:ABC transporter permease subunit [SAR324 cluster bacterium]
MLIFLLKRVGVVIPTFFGVTILTFFLIHIIPGDPILIRTGERGLSDERYAEMRAEMGLDKPLWKQYVTYITGVFSGDLGKSITTQVPVIDEFFTLFPATIELSVCASILAVSIGIPLGILTAVRRGSFFDYSVMTVSLTGYSMPIFWAAIMLILVFSVNLGWTPVAGRMSAMYWVERVTGFMIIDSFLSEEKGAVLSALRHLILPSIALATIPLAIVSRMTRSAMLEVLNEEYIRTAKAKGLSPFKVIFVHTLRNALIPVITVIGLQVGTLLSGAILTETIFAWPGIGKWMVDSISRRDYFAVQGGILMVATIVIMVNLLVDILYGVINPRIRHR